MLPHPFFSVLAALTLFLVSAQAARPATIPEPVAQPLSAAAREFLEVHNQARAAVGVEPLKWSEKLGMVTRLLVRYQRNNFRCGFANLTDSNYGANQLYRRGDSVAVGPRVAVGYWVAEKDFYIHANNSCVSNHKCEAYTQVVWRKSKQIGCAQASCVREEASLTICLYDPPGNFVGESPY